MNSGLPHPKRPSRWVDVLAVMVGAALALLVLTSLASAQTPDSHGEVATTSHTYRGVTASAPIPSSMDVHNEAAYGLGLCVVSSVLNNGMYQGVPGLNIPGPGVSNVLNDGRYVANAPGKGSALWRAAKSRPGGYDPEKLRRLVEKTNPGEPYVSYLGPDTSVLDKWSRDGYPIAVTMNTSGLYGYKKVNHMVSLREYRTGGWAEVGDNNEPGVKRWMPASEFDRRCKDAGIFWAWKWSRLPTKAETVRFLTFALCGLVAASIAYVFLMDTEPHPLHDATLDGPLPPEFAR